MTKSMNISILTATIKFIKHSERFDQAFFQPLSKKWIIHILIKLFVSEARCITTRVFALISFNLLTLI